jgi:hypothetical protein
MGPQSRLPLLCLLGLRDLPNRRGEWKNEIARYEIAVYRQGEIAIYRQAKKKRGRRHAL